MTTAILVYQARQHLGKLIEQASYLQKPFVLTRSRKPMAALIGAQVFTRLVELVEKYDPGRADTLAIFR